MSVQQKTKQRSWNAGRMIGAKPPLKPQHIWALRTLLEIDKRYRDLAMFNVAIDSKLRGCDLVRLRVADVVAGGTTRTRTSTFSRRQAVRCCSN